MMKLSLNNQGNRNQQILWLIVGAIAILVILCAVALLFVQFASLSNLAQLLSPSAKPTQVAGGPAGTSTPIVIEVVATPLPASPTIAPPPSPAPSPSITPTPSLTPTSTLAPTPTRTPTLTRTPTNTPTPDPWVALGQWKVACSTEVTFDPVSASRFKFHVLAGGGDDKTISFYCCRSGGAAWLVNDTWVPVSDPSLTLKVGETRETADFGAAIVNRQRFNVGCNDNEEIDVRVSYLPAPTPTITATATLTSTAALTTTLPLTATGALTSTPSITATAPATTTLAPTATLTPTAAITSTSGPITSTAPVSPGAIVTVTPTIPSAAPPLPKGGIAFHKNDGGIDRAYVISLENSTITPLVDIGPAMDLAMSTNAPFGAWSPDNSRFAFISTVSPGGSNILRVMDFKTNTTRPLFSSDTGGGLSSPTWSPDGTKIAFVRVAGNQRVWAIDVVNADATRCSDKYECEITTNSQGEQFRGGLSWSKTGLFALAINTTGANNVFTMFADGNGRMNLTIHPADDSTPTWSPDGKQIAFTSNRDGRPQIYVMNADGSNMRRVSQSEAGDVSPSWSPDGNWIAFASTREGSTDIYMMDLNGGNVTRLTKTGGDHPIWSH